MRAATSATVAIFLIVSLQQLASGSDTDEDIGDSYPFSRSRLVARQCTSCSSSQCQVMGMQRYSEPRCEQLGGLGAPCRMWQEPENKTLHFPNMILQCNDVYMQYCPCASGLVCDEAECKLPSRPGADVRQLEEDEIISGPSKDAPRRLPFPWAVPRFY